MRINLADMVIDQFPYPIARQFRRLETYECSEPGPRRLKHILTIAETIARFLGVITICEVRDLLEGDSQPQMGDLAVVVKKGIGRPSFGFWLTVCREGIAVLRNHNAKVVVPEIGRCILDKKGKPTDWLDLNFNLVKFRNDYSHDRIDHLEGGECARICLELDPLLEKSIERIAFLADYQLIYYQKIEVRKHRRGDAEFVHRFMRIAGGNDMFRSGDAAMADFADPQYIILRRRDHSQETGHLNLDPMLIYEREAGPTPDVYYFSGMNDPSSASFQSCSRSREKDQFRVNEKNFARGDEVAEELNHLLLLFQDCNSGGGPDD